MAISKERKREILDQYKEWIRESRAFFLAEYKGLPMPDFDTLRARARENGGEFHVVKNTLGKLAFEELGLEVKEGYLEGSTAIGFAFEDAPAMAKTLTDFGRTSDFLKIKGGFLGDQLLTAEDVKNLAELPPIEVMRARVLGMIMAPASQLARTLAEPGRQVAAVIQAFVDREQGPEEAAPEAAPEAA